METSMLACLIVSLALAALAVDGSLTGKWYVVGDIAGTISDSVRTLIQDGTKLAGSCKGEDSASEWVRLSKAINDRILADFNQQQQRGYDQIRAAQAIMEQTMKQEATFQANFGADAGRCSSPES